MGLPSGVQWASCNVGAEEPSDSGIYFSWGNIEGHAVGEGYDFSQAVYDTTPGAAIETNLSLEHDAASANLGTPWRMPSSAEFQELYDNCTCVWTTLKGVKGYLFTSNVNGNTLFFPAAGGCVGTLLRYYGVNGFYWSSTYYTTKNARRLRFTSSTIQPQSDGERSVGFSVRAVISTAT